MSSPLARLMGIATLPSFSGAGEANRGMKHVSSSMRTQAAEAIATIVGVMLLVVTPWDAFAQAPAELYAGKQIRMVIASGAGGGYDAYARALARHIGKYIPGNPAVINQNMPGASGMTATNWAYTIAPKDGSVI